MSANFAADSGDQSFPAGDYLRWLRLLQQMIRSTRGLRRALAEASRPHGLTDRETLTLLCCAEEAEQGVPQVSLAANVGVSPAQISSLVERLKRRGWVDDRRGTDDRRRVFWRLSPLGRTVLNRVLDTLQPTSSGWNQRLSDEVCANILAALRRLEESPDASTELRCVGDAECDANAEPRPEEPHE